MLLDAHGGAVAAGGHVRVGFCANGPLAVTGAARGVRWANGAARVVVWRAVACSRRCACVSMARAALFIATATKLASGLKGTSKQAAVRVRLSAVSTSLCRCAPVPPTAVGLAASVALGRHPASARVSLGCIASASASRERCWIAAPVPNTCVISTALAAVASAHRCATKTCSQLGYCCDLTRRRRCRRGR